ncbi:MAG: DUF4349 domain-containing protein [Chloroflexi bacterium]|nr:DUF4349 domain-containing protein [Chloroflexota bacterium]MCI0575439.1 DUF4349 domain-containing protein [Chloroflexota bacterium]MCI0649879.1 DUF4349 domain-containing protein [Chloroflexota bacterium]MCI0725649.1 DUF4349 domain-containing protein [Chloroflexota bacterium]
MKHLLKYRPVGLFLLALWWLVGCNGTSQPELIASYPRKGEVASGYRDPPGQWVVVHTAYLELEVRNTEVAAQRATDEAYERGGYLVSSYSWYRDGALYTTLALAVPVDRFEELRRELNSLGTVVSERVSETVVSAGRGSGPPFSQVTVQLQPAGTTSPPPVVSGGWSPANTFRQAFAVFMRIFQVLADIVIWVVVVAGPFVLAGLGLWTLVRRFRPRP